MSSAIDPGDVSGRDGDGPGGQKQRVITIGLVDDHELFRQGLAALINQERGFKIAWEATSAKDAVALVAQTPPDVTVMDVGLPPGPSGISATAEIVRSNPQARILMLTMHAREEFVVQALLAGATGFAIKTQRFEQILDAIRTVAVGKLYLAPGVSRSALDEYNRRIRGASKGVLDILSKRERDIFDLVVQNKSNRAISEFLGISIKTVETHRMAINKKLGLHSTAEIIRFAAVHGLIHS